MKKRKKRMQTLAIIALIFMVTLYPWLVKNWQFVQGIAADSRGNLAVAVKSVHSGDTVYLYIYSNENKLRKTVLLPNFRGGIDAIRGENDLIEIYYENHRYEYDFNGEQLIKETIDTSNVEIPQSLFECTGSGGRYVYSLNLIGLERVTKYTVDGKSQTVFNGIFLYIKKLLFSFVPLVIPIGVLYKIIYPDAKLDYSLDDLREIDAKLQGKIKMSEEKHKNNF